MEKSLGYIFIGKIFTCSNKEEYAEVIVTNGKIIEFIGSKKDCVRMDDLNYVKIELKDTNLVLPGFIDSHMHPILAGLQQEGCLIGDCNNVEEIQIKIREYAQQNDVPWIFCSGYKNTQFPNCSPLKKYLDQVISEKPVSILRFDGHAYFVNSKVIELGKISSENCPEEGIIEIDPKGQLSGVFEENAMDLIRNLFPKNKSTVLEDAFLRASRQMIENGITAFNDAAVKPYLFPI